jgi:hypothetical protein
MMSPEREATQKHVIQVLDQEYISLRKDLMAPSLQWALQCQAEAAKSADASQMTTQIEKAQAFGPGN